MPLDRGRFVVVHLCSTFTDCRQLAIPENAKSISCKILGFSRPEGNSINRWRRDLVPRWFIPSLDLILVYENCVAWTVMCGSYIACSRVLLLFNVVTHGCDLSPVIR